MKKIILSLLVLAGVFTMSSAQTTETIVAKHIAALGGAEKLRSVKSLVMENNISVQGLDLENKTTVLLNRSVRSDTKMMGNEMVQAFDGSRAWENIPVAMGGTGEPQYMAAESARTFAGQIDPFPLLDYAAKKTKLEYLGIEKLNENNTWHLKLVTKDSVESEMWIDSEKGMIRKMRTIQNGQAADIIFSNEREQDGIHFMTKMEIANPVAGTIVVETKTITLNTSIDPAIFQFPAKK